MGYLSSVLAQKSLSGELWQEGHEFEASLGLLNEILLRRRQLPIFSKRLSIPLLLASGERGKGSGNRVLFCLSSYSGVNNEGQASLKLSGHPLSLPTLELQV